MRRTPRLKLLIGAITCLAILTGCQSATKKKHAEEVIAEFEVKLATATIENADAEVKLALIVEYNHLPILSRERYEFGKRKYVQGQTETINVKSRESIPWDDRDIVALYIATESEDGYLPSHIWIEAISNQKNRFTLRDNDWKNQMLSTEVSDAEAVWPIVAASEWIVPKEEALQP